MANEHLTKLPKGAADHTGSRRMTLHRPTSLGSWKCEPSLIYKSRQCFYSGPMQRRKTLIQILGTAALAFALHAGLELRITNYVALSAEARQQWTTRKRADDVPDFANTGLTFVMGVAVGLPFDGRYARGERRRGRR